MAESESKTGIVKFEDVLDRELGTITMRRKRAAVTDTAAPPDATTPADRAASRNLIGLALSGGGVRSGAFCLGVLQGLHRRGVLPLVDFLSTVSGGGYAGAYLSSSALGTEPSASADTKTTIKPRRLERLDAALGTGNEQPQRIKDLIGKGGFLLGKSWSWLNRQVIGMLLIWAFVGSGLFAITSLAAYLYRSLDAVPCRQFLAVLGIADQLTLDLFPPLVMFLIYLLLWTITYLAKGGAAKARVARYWLMATIIVTLVALAKLMGSGNITTDAVAELIGQDSIDWIHGRFPTSLPSVIYGVIAASLLPLLMPRSLFRSGGEGQPGWHRWVFNIAGCALLAGVPFLLVGYFAHEGIGEAQRNVDDRVRVPHVVDWHPRRPSAPLWTSLRAVYPESTDSSASTAETNKPATPANQAKEKSISDLWMWVNYGTLEAGKQLDKKAGGLMGDMRELYGGLARYEMTKTMPLDRLTTENEWTWPTSRIGVLTRWYHLIEYCCAYTFGVDALDEYQFSLIRKKHEEIQNLKERMVFRLNLLLLRPDFYEYFPEDVAKLIPPAGVRLDALGIGKSLSDQTKEWKETVQRRRANAMAMKQAIMSQAGTPLERDLGNEVNEPELNAGEKDTPWLFELRPRWSLVSDNLKEEVSKDRSEIVKHRIREEQSFYPKSMYAIADLQTPMEREKHQSKRNDAENAFASALDESVCERLAATQSDSYYVAKSWRQVRELGPLENFIEKTRTKETKDDTKGDANERNADQTLAAIKSGFLVWLSIAKTKYNEAKIAELKRELPSRAKWSMLVPKAWQELPSGRSEPTVLQDVDRDLQSVLTSEAYKMRRMLEANRALLDAYFPGTIHPTGKTFSYMVLARDQEVRWSWFWQSLVCFVVLGLVLDLNATSWHGFYADRIASAWIQPVTGPGRKIPLGQLRTVDEGLPYHLISGSLNHFTHPQIGTTGPTELFLLSQQFAGSELTGYRAMSDLTDENYNLASAVAISGGAVNPLHVSNRLQQAMLLLGNVRLGQWLQNPGYGASRSTMRGQFLDFWPITPFRFFAALPRLPKYWSYCFVTDGGLTENLGIKQLLLRRCKLIVAADAGQDEKFQFHDLSKLLRWMQVEHGIRVTWQQVSEKDNERATKSKLGLMALSPLICTGSEDKPSGGDKPSGRPLNPDATQHFLLARIEYPGYRAKATLTENEKFVGYLVYMKSTICRDDPVDLVSYQQANPQFPHDPTSDFAFTRDQFESYRCLGEHTVESTLDKILGKDVSAGSGTEFIAAVGQDYRLSFEAKSADVGTPEQATGTIPPAQPAMPDASAAETASTTETGSTGTNASEPVQNSSETPAAGSSASPSSGASNSSPDPDQCLKDAFKHGDLMSRKEAVHGLNGFPDHQRQLVKDLVKQLGDASGAEVEEVHCLLIDLHDKPLLWLCDSFELQRVDCQIRSVRVIGDILLDHCDLPTVRELCRWLKKDDVRERVKHEIRHALRRIPLDGYSADEMLTEEVSLALHSH